MTCDHYRSAITDAARGQTVDAASREHIDACAVCAALLADELALSKGLSALRAATRSNEAPAGVETVLASAFRQHAARAARRKMPYRWAGMAVAASVALIALWRVAAPVNVSAPQSAPVAPEPKPAQVATATRKETAHAQAARVRRPTPVRKPAPRQSRELSTEFVALPGAPAWAPNEGGQVIRVRLPMSSVRTLGFPVNEDRFGERVNADVIMGQDGVARAIRFVK